MTDSAVERIDPTRFARESSPDAVARYVRALIVGGELRRGDKVPQDEIATTLGVSRIPVREAIIALDREGWLEIEPHRGAFVHGVDEDWVVDHYELIGNVYALVAERASRRASDDEIARLRALRSELSSTVEPEDFDSVNTQLTRTLVDAARSPRLEAALRGVANIVPGNFFVEVPGTMEPQRQGMLDAVGAVIARDGDRAAAFLRELPATQSAAVVALLRSRGVIDAHDAPRPT